MWSSLNNSILDNYFKLNYLIFFLVTTSFLTNFPNNYLLCNKFPNKYLTPFLILISYPSNFPNNYFIPVLITIFYFYNYLFPNNHLTPFPYPLPWIWKDKLTCIFSYPWFILIQIKFNIDINNDELLKIIWEHKKTRKKTWSLLIMRINVEHKHWLCTTNQMQ
jgi:hypothetical protein